MAGLYSFSLILIFSFALLVLFLLFYISAPYGKFLRSGWGPALKSKWAWMIMESPSPVLMLLLFLTSPGSSAPQFIFIVLWLSHYLHRTFIYPFSQSGREKDYPAVLVLMAFFFNCMNGFVNGYGVFHINDYDLAWLISWQFIGGIIIFVSGFMINKISDGKLRHLRQNNPDGYVIPRGWLFEYVSCPHYFGEIIEWTGWALLTWSVSGLAFAVFTFANLFPRAVSSHKWYRQHFADYPSSRKAVIPFLI